MDSSHSPRLVVFGCGYVGGTVARQAVARGWRVQALTRNAETARGLQSLGIEVVCADLADAEWHGRIAGAPDYVLNCVGGGAGDVAAYRHSYVDGQRSLRRWAETAGGIGTLVYTSSTSVYPQGQGAVVDETAGHDGVTERGAILLEAERGLPEAPACGRSFILRLAGLYGPGRHHLLEQVRAGVVSGRGEHRLNLVHRDDAARAVFAAFEAAPTQGGGVFNVADDTPTPKAEVAAWLAQRLGVPPPAFSGEPAGARRGLTPDRVIANERLKRELGWRPRFPSFREGYENILSPGAE